MMLREHWVNQLDNFIMGWYINNDLCNNIIEYHKNCPNKWEGLTGTEPTINKSFKDSIDCKLDDISILQNYYKELQKCVDLYIEKYPICNDGDPWTTIEKPNLQYYGPNCGYHAWHNERNTCNDPEVYRHLVFITYLNDVTDRGETEFFYQKLKIKPEKGLTIIWPADWTFTHRGVASPTQDKYIYTGWFSFYRRG